MEVNKNNLHLYSIAQAAKLLHIGRDTLHTLIAQGKIGVIKILKRNKISQVELERFIANNTVLEKRNIIEVSANTFPELPLRKNIKVDTEKIFDTMIKEIK
jgi:excisionase family DNA binding protein